MLLYAVVRTKWGYFGLAGVGQAVCRTFLPVPEFRQAEQGLFQCLQADRESLRLDKGFQQDLQQRIVAYYEGELVDFLADPPVRLGGSSPFVHRVLHACRKIKYGYAMTYSELARQAGSPNAARAVGSVMAGNPIPLIIPCHRVLRMDGGLGGFSAPGGTATKRRMLQHEQAVLGAISGNPAALG